MKTVFRNLTPHAVNILNRTNNTVIRTFESEGSTIRLKESIESLPSIDGIEITRSVFESDHLAPLPKVVEGTFLIVSRMIQSAFPTRTDLLTPNEVVREVINGRPTIVGCYSLS